MSYRLGGRNALPYLGVEALQPPDLIVINRPPTINDSQNFNIGTIWVVPTPPGPNQVYLLVSLSQNVATWISLFPVSTGLTIISNSGTASPAGGFLNVVGGASAAGTNINTSATGNTVDIILNNTLVFPNTTEFGIQGAFFFGGTSFLHNYGTNNTFLGANAGSLTDLNSDNTGIGNHSLTIITSGDENTAVGSLSLTSSTIANENTAVGYQALNNLVSGINNIAIGVSSGTSYTTNESDNVLIANSGILAESGVIHIGNPAVQTTCFIAAIAGNNLPAAIPVYIDSATGQLGTGITVPVLAPNYVSIVLTAAVSYTADPDDCFISVDTTGNAVTILLPDNPIAGRIFYIADSEGNALANAITITTVSGSTLIAGATSQSIGGDYGTRGVIYNGVSYDLTSSVG